jgi:hypothetical protein
VIRKNKGKTPDELAAKLAVGVEGYVGRQKGISQILFERGLYKEGMQLHQTNTLIDGKRVLPEDLDMKRVLARQRDFINEKCALQSLIEGRGHIVSFFLFFPFCTVNSPITISSGPPFSSFFVRLRCFS